MEPSNAEEWHDRLGWAFDLISDDVVVRHRALARHTRTRQLRHEAFLWYNQIWNQPDHPQYRERRDAWHRAQEDTTLRDALSSYVSPQAVAAWDGLPYAVLYLRWEATFSQEWHTYAKSWSLKGSLLRLLADVRADLPADIVDDLVDLTLLAARRVHRCQDVWYARLARRLDGTRLRTQLTAIADQPTEPARTRARYVLWLLNHPDAPRPKRSQWLSWLNDQHE
jgi:hypothetical protein